MTTPQNQPVDYLFELVIQKRGQFIMSRISLKEWLDHDKKMLLILKHKGIELEDNGRPFVKLKTMQQVWN